MTSKDVTKLGFIAALLVVAAIGVEWLHAERVTGNRIDQQLIAVAPSEITGLEIAPKDQDAIVLAKSDNGWGVPGVPAIRLSQSEVEGLVGQILGAKALHAVAKKDLDAAAIGEQVGEVIIITTQGKRRIKLFGRTLLDQHVYASLDDSSAITVISGSVASVLETTIEQLRDRAMFSIATDEIGEISVRRRTDTLTLTRTPETGWRVTSPVWDYLDPKRSVALIRSVCDLQASSFELDGSDVSSLFNDEKSDYTLTLKDQDGKRTEIVDLVFDRTSLSLYAKRRDLPSVVKVDTMLINDLNSPSGEFRYPRVFLLPQGNVTACTVKQGKDSFSMRLDNDKTRWLSGETVLDTQKVKDFIQKLILLPIKTYEVGTLNIPPDAIQIAIVVNKQRAAIQVWPGPKNTYFAVRSGQSNIFRVDPKDMPEIGTNLVSILSSKLE